MSHEAYAEKMAAEHQNFLRSIPVSCRGAVGLVFYKDSKLDWEIRAFLAPFMFQYALLKVDEDEANTVGNEEELKRLKDKRIKLLNRAMERLLERFPDCRPTHPLRLIKDRLGEKAEGKFLAMFRTKFTSDAGRMKTHYLKSGGGKVGSVGTKTSISTLLEILGKKRAHIAFHLWGGSEAGGKAACDPAIEQELKSWAESNPKMTAQEISWHRITVVHSVRYALFKVQDDEVKELWRQRAKAIHIPKTPEEERCLADAALPYILELLKLLAERANMHFVLLVSGWGSCNLPIIVEEFVRKSVNYPPFVSDTNGIGARMKSDYVDYALKRHGGDINDAITGVADLGMELNGDEESPEATLGESGKGESEGLKATKAIVPRQTYVEPFKPDLGKIKKTSQMSKAISDFIMGAVEKIHGRTAWDKITKFSNLYVDTGRMPSDPDSPGQPLQIQKPAAMSDTRIKALFYHLVNSYNGSLPEEQCFRFKYEARHLNLPAPIPPTDPSIHYAGAVAARTTVPKRKGTTTAASSSKGKRSKATIPVPDDGDFQDLPGIMVEANEAILDEALDRVPELRPNTSGNLAGSSTQPPGKARPKTALDTGVDEIYHSLLVPKDARTKDLWSKTKAVLQAFGKKLTFSAQQSQTMPFTGISAPTPAEPLPSALNAVISILQLWHTIQEPAASKPPAVVEVAPMLGVNDLHPSHHIASSIAVVLDPKRTLPSAKLVYEQMMIGSGAASAFFVLVEQAVAGFIDNMVSSEETVLFADIKLLQGFRLAVFMGGSAFIRDNGRVGSCSMRMSAQTDRFVTVVSAIALARYFKVILGRVAELYSETSPHAHNRSMWVALVAVWNMGCSTLARALVKRRSDLFLRTQLSTSLPKNFAPIIRYAFTSRPWWSTPDDTGAPGILSIQNRQAVASNTLFTLLKSLKWSELTFLERSQLLLLVLLGAVQIEGGRVIGDTADDVQSAAQEMENFLTEFLSMISTSGETGVAEEPISIPIDSVSEIVELWRAECRTATQASGESPASMPTNQPVCTKDVGEPDTDNLPHTREPEEKMGSAGSQMDDSSRISTVSSHLPPEEEDLVFSEPQAPLQTTTDPIRDDALETVPAKVIPATRTLEGNEPDSAPPKKRRRGEIDLLEQEATILGARVLRSSGPKQPQAPAQAPAGGSASSGTPQQGDDEVNPRKKRERAVAKASTQKGAGRGRAATLNEAGTSRTKARGRGRGRE